MKTIIKRIISNFFADEISYAKAQMQNEFQKLVERAELINSEMLKTHNELEISFDAVNKRIQSLMEYTDSVSSEVSNSQNALELKIAELLKEQDKCAVDISNLMENSLKNEKCQERQKEDIGNVLTRIDSVQRVIDEWKNRIANFSENIKNNNIEMEKQRKLFCDFSENIRNNNNIIGEQERKFADYGKQQKNNEEIILRQNEIFESYSINLKNNNQLMDQMLDRTTKESKRVDTLERGLISLQKELNCIEKTGIKTGTNNTEITVKGKIQDDTYYSIDYLDFENNFRGSRSQIKENQRQYIPYFADKKHVLDIGCGRGEFLELLGEEGVAAIGVDLYEDFVLYCKTLGQNVVQDDGIHFLREMEYTDGIFAGQVVEHMTTAQILELCDLAYKKLLPGSYLVIETPNPTSLAIYTNAFYIDPSHIKPVHPLTMKYFLNKSGFSDVSIIYTNNSELPEIPRIQGKDIENLNAFNDVMGRVSKMMFGSQDYAIIARKD